jgi:TetR/AcrR family transcriptional regulator
MSPASAARRHDPEASRAAILDAAEATFVEKGFAGASMSEIAERSNVTKSLIHHHFGSKEALWSEVKKRSFSSYHAQQMQLYAAGELTPETVRASMAAYFRFLGANPQVVRLLAWMRLEHDLDCAAMVVELRTLGILTITEAQRLGILRADVPAEHILIAFLGLTVAYFNDGEFVTDGQPQRIDPEAYLASAWKVFSEGLMPRAPAP